MPFFEDTWRGDRSAGKRRIDRDDDGRRVVLPSTLERECDEAGRRCRAIRRREVLGDLGRLQPTVETVTAEQVAIARKDIRGPFLESEIIRPADRTRDHVRLVRLCPVLLGS